jgi:hypothetical protein
MTITPAERAAIIAELRSGVFPKCYCGEAEPHRHGDPRSDEAALTSLATQGINNLCEALELVSTYEYLPGQVGLDVLNGIVEGANDDSVNAGGDVDMDYLVRRGGRVFLLTHQCGAYDWHEFGGYDTVDELVLDLSVYFGCHRPVNAVAMLLSWQDRAVENLGESRWRLTLGGETAVVAERVEALGSGWEKVDSEAGA